MAALIIIELVENRQAAQVARQSLGRFARLFMRSPPFLLTFTAAIPRCTTLQEKKVSNLKLINQILMGKK